MKDINFSKYKLIIFDFDGTLYDYKDLPRNLIMFSFPRIFKVWAVQKVRKQLKGIDFENKFTYEKEFFSLLCMKGKFKNQDEAEFWYKNFYMKKMIAVLKSKYTMRQNLVQVFENLKALNKKIAIYSDYGNLSERLSAVGFNLELQKKLLNGIFSSEDFGCLKPVKRGFVVVAERLDVTPGECLFIGDREDTDGVGAIESGMDFIQIKTYKNMTKEEKPQNFISFEDFTQQVLSIKN